MATTISPSLGAAPSFLQGGVGASPGYSAIDVRRPLFATGMQEGVIDSGSYEVTERGAGANLSVDIAASSGSGAVVQGDSVTAQGLYYVPPHSATINEAIATADATNPRIDSVILEILDDTHAGGGSNLARVRVLTGTPTAGATLDNLNGASSVPGSALLLARILVPASDTTISNSQIRDRRTWARGAYIRRVPATGADYTTTSSSLAALDSTSFSTRLECSGVPIEILFRCRITHSADTAWTQIECQVDGASDDGTTRYIGESSGTTSEHNGTMAFSFVPTAGTHVFDIRWATSVATATLYRSTNALRPVLTISEQVRQNARNNTTTSG